MTGHPARQRGDERLRRSVQTLYAAIDSHDLPAVSEACGLIQLDRLIRRYPAACTSLRPVRRRIPRHASGRAPRPAARHVAHGAETTAGGPGG